MIRIENLLRVFGIIGIFAITGCQSQPQSEAARAYQQNRGPSSIYVTNTRSGSYIRADTNPFTKSGTVKSMTLEFWARTDIRPGGDAKVIAVNDADYATLWSAVQARDPSQRAVLQRIAATVARATFCREGPVTLNTGWRGQRPGEPVRAIDPITSDTSLFEAITVRLSCNATNPYYSAERLARARSSGPTAADLRARVVGKTQLSVSNAHGTQVEYLAPNGTAHLWYPGNTRVNSGRWRIRTAPGPENKWTEICFFYGPASFNPVTRQRGAESCRPAAQYLSNTDDHRDGDVFGLSSGSIPFVMQRQTNYSFEILSAQGRR